MRYLTATRRILSTLSILGIALTACEGYTPPVFPGTQSPVLSTTSPSWDALPTRQSETRLETPTPLPSPISTLGIKAEEVQGITLRYWHVRSGVDEDVFTELAEEFNRTNPWGIRAEMTTFEDPTELVDRIQSGIYGELPDLAPLYPYQAAHLRSSGGLPVDLSPYIFDPEWGFTPDELADFYPLFWGREAVRGSRLGIPFYHLAQVLAYNESWADELGFDSPPSTPQEFQAQACSASGVGRQGGEGGEGYGGWLIDTDTATITGWLAAFGTELTPSGNQGYALNAAQTRQAFVFLRQMLDQGCAWKGESLSSFSDIADRKALIRAESTASLQDQAAAFELAGSADRWAILPFPSPDGTPVLPVYGPSLSILKSEPDRQLAAWLFLKWLVSPENQKRLVEETGALPSRISAIDLLGEYRSQHPQWSSVLDLLPFSRLEPGDASWKTVRMVLSDAAGQLFSPTFQSSQIPELVEMLDATADEMYSQTR